MPRAILHIGTAKTGTSALQRYLAENRSALRKRGFMFSTVAGKANQRRLSCYATDDGNVRDLDGFEGIYSAADLRAFREAFCRDLAGEATADPDATFIFSNEHCHSKLTRDSEVERLRDLFARLFSDIRVVVYIRRQDELVVSRYSTALRSGLTHEDIIRPEDHSASFCDNWEALSRWTGAFGEDHLLVGIYSRAALRNGSIVSDFCALTGVPELPHTMEATKPSLSGPYQEFLRQMNLRMRGATGDERRAERRELGRAFSTIGAGPGRLPSRAEAERLVQSHGASNERVRARYFPERPTLFDEDFSAYPEEAPGPSLDLDAALDISVELWRLNGEERLSLRAEVEHLRARLALAEGKPRLAVRLFEHALRLRPDHAGALAGVGEARRARGPSALATLRAGSPGCKEAR